MKRDMGIEKVRDLRNTFPWAPVSGMKKMRGVPSFSANPENTPDDGGLKRELFKWESPKPFAKRACSF